MKNHCFCFRFLPRPDTINTRPQFRSIKKKSAEHILLQNMFHLEKFGPLAVNPWGPHFSIKFGPHCIRYNYIVIMDVQSYNYYASRRSRRRDTVKLASNPGPLRRGPGIYCMGDSAHAQLCPPESGGSVHASKPS